MKAPLSLSSAIKISILFVVILLNGHLINAQEIEWQKTLGGNNTDVLNATISTSDGGYLFGGISQSPASGDKTEGCHGGPDYWILKTDSIGAIQWQQTIGGSGNDYLYSVLQTSDGGYLLGGYSSSGITGDKTEASMGGYDYWIVKIDATGNILWQNVIGGAGDDVLKTMISTPDGGFLIGGSSYSNISGDKTENCYGVLDFWLVKTDSVGVPVWQKTIGGDKYDYLETISQTSNGNLLLGGYSNSDSTGLKTENSLGGADYWVMMTDGTGNIQWQNTIGGNANDYLTCIAPVPNDGFLLGGYSNSNISDDKAENSIGGDDYFILRIDSLGNILWQNTIGGADDDKLYAISVNSEGQFLLGGDSYSEDTGDKNEFKVGNNDMWIIKTDTIGNILWQNDIGGNTSEFLNALISSSDGGYIIGGISNSGISGDKTQSCRGDFDFWVMKISEKYDYVTGHVFADMNSNGVYDSSEFTPSYLQVNEINTGRFAITNSSGNYFMTVFDTGSFVIEPGYINYYNSVPSQHYASFNSYHNTDSLNDFAFQPTGNFDDLCIYITPLGPFRPGFTSNYMVSYENGGTTTLTPTIVFYPDTNVTYLYASIPADSVYQDSVVFSVNTLAPFQTGSFTISVITDLFLPNGTLINSHVLILPIINDVNPACNYGFHEVLSSGSLDPNDILVNRDTLYDFELSTSPWLEYLIRFQNTGNDTAFYVRVDNKINAELNINSIDLIASSHPCQLDYLPYDHTMRFIFNNILLPDSNVNEIGSHGFVRYRIHPLTTLTAGQTIFNSARIIFDYNTPVETNIVETIIVGPTTVNEANSQNYSIFPNPTSGLIELRFKQPIKTETTIEVLDMYGKLLISEKANSNDRVNLDLSKLSTGTYLIKVEGETTSYNKIIKL